MLNMQNTSMQNTSILQCKILQKMQNTSIFVKTAIRWPQKMASKLCKQNS